MSKHIGYFLPIFFKEEEWKMKLFSQWETIVGGLSSKMRIEKIDHTTLLIGVYHSAWLQELYALSYVLKKSINQQLGKEYITHIKFKQATKHQPAPHKEKKPQEIAPVYTEKVLLQDHEKNALEKIKDRDLQTVLHNFLTRCYYQKIQSKKIYAL